MNVIKRDLSVFAQWIASTLFSMLFLSFWIFLQWILARLINQFPLTGLDFASLALLQWLFSIATLIPIAAYIFKHSILTILEVWKTITDEIGR